MPSSTPLAFRHPAFHGNIGISRADITPPIGIYSRNWGAAKHDVAESIHRPLTLTAVVLKSIADDTRTILIEGDLGWWKTPETFTRFHSHLLEALNIQPEQLVFALSHTHAGPPLMSPDESLPGMDLLKEWTSHVLKTAVQTALEAEESASSATLEWHTGTCGLASVRDLIDPTPGADRTLCGFTPEGTPDNTLVIGRITSSSGQSLGTIVNYACHPTTLAWENKAISPDYIGAMRETVESVTGAPAIFLLGMCGDLAPRYQYVGDTSVADAHGCELGYAALSTLNGMEPSGNELRFRGTVESGAPLAVWRHEPCEASTSLSASKVAVDLPLKDWPTADELEQQRLACTDRSLEERLRRKRDIRRTLGDGNEYRLPITVWKIGDAVLVGSCCEGYSILQQELRRRFPETTLICMNLINGSLGYLPPAELYSRDIYPVWQTPFDKGCLEKTLEAMTQGIHQILTH